MDKIAYELYACLVAAVEIMEHGLKPYQIIPNSKKAIDDFCLQHGYDPLYSDVVVKNPITIFRFACQHDKRFVSVEDKKTGRTENNAAASLMLVEHRDGVDAARRYASDAATGYKKMIGTRSGMCSVAQKRREFVTAYVAYRFYLNATEPPREVVIQPT
jgi:hypothetical protein